MTATYSDKALKIEDMRLIVEAINAL